MRNMVKKLEYSNLSKERLNYNVMMVEISMLKLI